MAKSNKSKKNEFAEFKLSGEVFEYSGRVYPAKKKGDPFVYLTLNDVFTIQAHLKETKKGDLFLSFPSWKDSDGEYHQYTYIDKALNDEMDKLVVAINDALEDME